MTKSLSIIIGSTRTNRVGRDIAEWVSTQAKEAGFDTVELLDLKEINLPKFDTPVPPMYAPLESAEAKAWAQQINTAEHVLVLTPEYNRSIPASLKSAIDYLSAEWNGKPTAIVGYGYMDAAGNARKHLSEILEFLKTDLVEATASIQLSDATVVDGSFSAAGVSSEETATLKSVVSTLAAK